MAQMAANVLKRLLIPNPCRQLAILPVVVDVPFRRAASVFLAGDRALGSGLYFQQDSPPFWVAQVSGSQKP